MEQRGVDLGEIDSRIREGFEDALKEPEPPVSVVHDVSSFVEAKRRARSMHRSQFGEGGFFSRIPEDLRDRLDGEERFYQGRPEWPPATPPSMGFPDLPSPA